MAELLKVDNVSMVFGGLRAVSNLSMHIDEGELIGLIGPNGAGKTTAFNMITGVYTPTEGKVYFNGQQSSGKNLTRLRRWAWRVHSKISVCSLS